jgi:hypothetical protein
MAKNINQIYEVIQRAKQYKVIDQDIVELHRSGQTGCQVNTRTEVTNSIRFNYKLRTHEILIVKGKSSFQKVFSVLREKIKTHVDLLLSNAGDIYIKTLGTQQELLQSSL